jgi:nitric oxide reductase subunit B
MRYASQKVAYWFFALSMLLLTLQIVYGFIMGFAHLGYDGLHDFIPFNTAVLLPPRQTNAGASQSSTVTV